MPLNTIHDKLRTIQTLTPAWIRDGHDAETIYVPLKSFQSLLTQRHYRQAEDILDQLLAILQTHSSQASLPPQP